jgi:hypothetical protein
MGVEPVLNPMLVNGACAAAGLPRTGLPLLTSTSANLRASLVETEKTQTEKREFSSPKTQVLSNFAVPQNRTRKTKLKTGIRIGAGKLKAMIIVHT